jgi:lisH domain-containing protein FOPNL
MMDVNIEEKNSIEAADSDLVFAVDEALKRRGVLGKMKAQMRAEVFHALNDSTVIMPEKPPDIFLASELIREFLMAFNLNNTLTVFCEELGQPPEMNLDRLMIGNELGVNTVGSDEKIPLLVLLMQFLKKNRRSYLESATNSVNINESLVVEKDDQI